MAYTFTPYVPRYQNAYRPRYGISGPGFTAPQPFFTREQGAPQTFDDTFGSSSSFRKPAYPGATTKPLDMGPSGLLPAAISLGSGYVQSKIPDVVAANPSAGIGEQISGAFDLAKQDVINLPDTISTGVKDLGSTVSGWLDGPAASAPTYTPSAALTGSATTPIATAPGAVPGVSLAPDGSILRSAAGTPAAANAASGNVSSGFFGPGAGGAGVMGGVTSFGLDLMFTDKSVGEAALGGVDAGVGTALGSAFGPIGGFVGGTVGKAVGSILPGRVICTELYEQGRIDRTEYLAEQIYTLRNISPYTVRGYHLWAIPYVAKMRQSQALSAFTASWAGARAKEIAYQAGHRQKGSLYGKLVRWVMEPPCFILGLCAASLKLPKPEFADVSS